MRNIMSYAKLEVELKNYPDELKNNLLLEAIALEASQKQLLSEQDLTQATFNAFLKKVQQFEKKFENTLARSAIRQNQKTRAALYLFTGFLLAGIITAAITSGVLIAPMILAGTAAAIQSAGVALIFKAALIGACVGLLGTGILIYTKPTSTFFRFTTPGLKPFCTSLTSEVARQVKNKH